MNMNQGKKKSCSLHECRKAKHHEQLEIMRWKNERGKKEAQPMPDQAMLASIN
jgi:hypothetical protein